MQLVWRRLVALATSSSGLLVSGISRKESGKSIDRICIHILISTLRQCNMDYLFASSVLGSELKLLRISYDVACQWFVNFWKRMCLLPPQLCIALPQVAVEPKVPKFHLQSHTEVCHGPYAFNYTIGGGRTDGEGVERNWKGLNGQAPSTSEMGAGARYDTLDDCCGHMNWRKTVGMGKPGSL